VKVALRVDDDRMTIFVRGDVDLESSHLLYETALQVLVMPQTRVVVFDLSRVGLLDATGVGALMKAYITLARHGRAVAVENATGIVAAVLRLTGADEELSLDRAAPHVPAVAVYTTT
jgi:anti-anti-sigma factor